MREYKPTKTSTVLQNIAFGLFAIAMLSLLGVLITQSAIWGITMFVAAAILMVISDASSGIYSYTSEFIKYMEVSINQADTLQDFYKIENEFQKLAIKNNRYILRYINDLRKIHTVINSKIEVLEKMKVKYEYKTWPLDLLKMKLEAYKLQIDRHNQQELFEASSYYEGKKDLIEELINAI